VNIDGIREMWSKQWSERSGKPERIARE